MISMTLGSVNSCSQNRDVDSTFWSTYHALQIEVVTG